MNLLFKIDTKDYDINNKKIIRPSVRSIIIKDNKVAMVYSKKYDYYKFPGGGIEENESKVDALIRETREEAGLVIIPATIREYGYVHRIQKIENDAVFIQDNFYYTCDVEPNIVSQNLDDYESEESFTLEYVQALKAIDTNRTKFHGSKDMNMLEREAKVLELLMKEGALK